jgi:protease secretion system outer membrane protein
MRLNVTRGVIALACAVFSLSVAANEELTLGRAIDAARAFDPGYSAGQHALTAAREGKLVASGGLLPQINLSAATSSTRGSRRFANSLNQDVTVALDYESPQASLTMRWPLINMEGFAAIEQSKAQVELAEQQFRAEGLDLLDRVTTAYLQLVAAQETLALVKAQVLAASVQLSQASSRQSAGEGTVMQTAQAAANLESARSRVVDAETQLLLARAGVSRVTGLSDFRDPQLPSLMLPPPIYPAELGDWKAVAQRSNPLVRAREQALDIARAQVKRQFAGHLPRLDVFASVSKVRSDGVSTIGQDSTLRTVGVQLQVPLFSGGAVQASVRQAQARQRQADEELRRERETVSFELSRHWQQMISGEARVLALNEAISASSLSLRGAARARQEGMATAADEANLRSSDLELRRQLAQARIDLMLARVRMQSRAGIPFEEIVADMERIWPAALTE